MTSPAGPPDAATHQMRWRRVFPGDERQLSLLRGWLASLLPQCAARDSVVSISVELATNAVKFTNSGRGGWFAVEIARYGRTMRVAVADGGAPTGPQVTDDPLSEHGRGLLIVRALAARVGVSGDHRGRLVWAEIPCSGEETAEGVSLPGYEAAIRQDETALTERFAGMPIWFGRSTLQWWALPYGVSSRLLTAPSARELASLLDRMMRPPPNPGQMAVNEPGAALMNAPTAPVSPCTSRATQRLTRLGAQPC